MGSVCICKVAKNRSTFNKSEAAPVTGVGSSQLFGACRRGGFCVDNDQRNFYFFYIQRQEV